MNCPKCDGTGEIRYHFDEGNISGSGTHLCDCRKDLPLRYGDVRWWDCKTIHSETLTTSDGLTGVTVSVRAEVPISEDNYPLHRTAGNCHFRHCANIDIDCGPATTSDGLREIAAFMLRMADKVDELDAPVPDCPGQLVEDRLC